MRTGHEEAAVFLKEHEASETIEEGMERTGITDRQKYMSRVNQIRAMMKKAGCKKLPKKFRNNIDPLALEALL